MNDCHDCRKLKVQQPTGRVKWCSDGYVRCSAHRADWLEKTMKLYSPARPVPPSVGEQRRLV